MKEARKGLRRDLTGEQRKGNTGLDGQERAFRRGGSDGFLQSREVMFAESEWGRGAFQMEGTPEVSDKKEKGASEVGQCEHGAVGWAVRGGGRAQGVGLVATEEGHAGS